MAVVITSTTAPQAELDHAVGEDWREGQEPIEEPKPVVEEAAPETAEEEPKPEPAKAKEHKSGWQKRIDKLTARNHSLETRLAELEAKAKPADAKVDAQPADTGPKLADYNNNLEEFLKARDAWKDAETSRQSEQERQRATFDNYNKKVSEARGQYEDWDEVVSGSAMKIPQAAYLAVTEEDNGPEVAYYLAQHPDEVETLNDLTPIGASRYIGKLAARLAGEKATPIAKPKVKPPAPVAPVGTSATRSSVTLGELPIREYIKIRNKEEREKRYR